MDYESFSNWISSSYCQTPLVTLLHVFRVHFPAALMRLVLGIEWLNEFKIAASISDSIRIVEATLVVLFSQKDRTREDEADEYNANYSADASIGGIGIGIDSASTNITVVISCMRALRYRVVGGGLL